MHKGAGLGADIYLIIYRRRRIRFAIRWWSRLGENGISCCLFLHQTTTIRILLNLFVSCISSVSYIKPQPIISNKLYTNILLIFFIIKNGRVGFVSIAKILKKLQLNRFADDFFCDFA